MARLGVFLIPPTEHPFYRIATGLLEYDVWQRRQLTWTSQERGIAGE